jgi:hypothetical protein
VTRRAVVLLVVLLGLLGYLLGGRFHVSDLPDPPLPILHASKEPPGFVVARRPGQPVLSGAGHWVSGMEFSGFKPCDSIAEFDLYWLPSSNMRQLLRPFGYLSADQSQQFFIRGSFYVATSQVRPMHSAGPRQVVFTHVEELRPWKVGDCARGR